jgi:hypothetical protein
MAIKDLVVYNFQSQKYLPQALHELVRQFYHCHQSKHMTTQAYLKMFQNTVDVIQHSGGVIGDHPGLKSIIMTKKGLTPALLTDDKRAEVKKAAQEEYLAVAFVLNADRARYSSMIQDLGNDFLQGAKTTNQRQLRPSIQPADLLETRSMQYNAWQCKLWCLVHKCGCRSRGD